MRTLLTSGYRGMFTAILHVKGCRALLPCNRRGAHVTPRAFGVRRIGTKCWQTALVASFALHCSIGAAQYPSKPIRFIVPWGPGSGPDVRSRLLTAAPP